MRTTSSVLCAGLAALLLFPATPVIRAQSSRVPSRVVEKIDDTKTVQLKGNVHPLARPEFDRGALADSQPMKRMLLMLQRSAQQEIALQQLIDAQHAKGSASYHAWLTPAQFGKQFGPSDSDVQAVTDWLSRQGFQVSKVSAGRTVIEFDGNVAQVRNAFHTEMHKFAVNGETRVANVSEPSIPEALAPVVKGLVALNDFPRHSHVHYQGTYRWQRDTGQIRPLFTYGTPANFAMAPADFNKIYNVPSTATGAGQTIAIVADSNINAQDVIDFRNLFNLPQNFTQNNNVLVNGPDPGLNSDEGEADLDVEWAGAIAPQANILLVTSSQTSSNPTQITTGIDLSALYIVDNDPAVNGVPASILSESFGECEPLLTANGNIFYSDLWQQAAAEGITVVVSSGDSGSAGCDPDPSGSSPNAAIDGLAVNGIASTPYNVAVGGTDFDPTAQPVTPPNQYWSATNGPTFASALQYIPETTWDNSLCAANFPTGCATVDPNGNDLAAASGGPSNCGFWTGTNGNCRVGYPIPAYQIGINKVFPSVRTVPDISFFSSNGNNGVAAIVCEADSAPQNGATCQLSSPFTDFGLVGGTSLAAPSFAGVVALLNQTTGVQRSGLVNYGLYALAANDTNYTSGQCNSSIGNTPASSCVFNDVTKGNIAVACQLGSTSNADGSTNWCNPGNGTNTNFGVTVINGTNNLAYAAGTGYDAATGLGSINVGKLLSSWNNANRAASTTTLSSPSGGSPSGTNFTATVSVSPSSATGNVSLIALSSSNPNSVLAAIGGKTANSQTTPFTLSGGTVQVQTNLLPPGTTYVMASYSGDATNAGSTSTPVALAGAVAGANYSSKTQLNYVSFDSNNNPVPTTQSQTIPYGSPYILNMIVSRSDGTNCGFNYPYTQPQLPCPTGKITLTDNGNPLNDFPSGPNFNVSNLPKLSNMGGLVEDQFVQLTGGTHSIVATYSGDANYSTSTSNTLSIKIVPAATTVTATANPGIISSGGSVTLLALIATNSNGEAPCGVANGGTVTFSNGSSPISGTVSYTAIPPTATASVACQASLSTSLSSLFPPPADEPRPTMPLLPVLFAVCSLALFALGWRWIPQNRRRAYVYAGFLVIALITVGIVGCGGGGGSSGGGGHTVTINVAYSGDTNYAASTGSTSVSVQ